MASLVEEVIYFKEMALLKLRYRSICFYGAGFVTERFGEDSKMISTSVNDTVGLVCIKGRYVKGNYAG